MSMWKVVSRSVVSGCILHWDDVSLGAGKLWAVSVRGVFLLAEFILFVDFPCARYFPCVWDSCLWSLPAGGGFRFVNFFCSRNFPYEWVLLFVEISCLRRFSGLWTFPAHGTFLVCELSCLWNSPAQVFCLESFTDCVVPPILALYTFYGLL